MALLTTKPNNKSTALGDVEANCNAFGEIILFYDDKPDEFTLSMTVQEGMRLLRQLNTAVKDSLELLDKELEAQPRETPQKLASNDEAKRGTERPVESNCGVEAKDPIVIKTPAREVILGQANLGVEGEPEPTPKPIIKKPKHKPTPLVELPKAQETVKRPAAFSAVDDEVLERMFYEGKTDNQIAVKLGFPHGEGWRVLNRRVDLGLKEWKRNEIPANKTLRKL